MDPLTVLVSALMAGAMAGMTETAAQAIKDTYAALKARLAHKLGAQSEAVQALVAVEKKPDSAGRQATLKEELAAAGAQRDAELLRLAQALLDAVARITPGASAHDHSVAVAGSDNVVASAGSMAIGGNVLGDVIFMPPPATSPLPSLHIYHNLPQPEYGQFIGREKELARIQAFLRPYPASQHAVVVIDGIGGVGKSALALEVAHRYRRDFNTLPEEERFYALIWLSAKPVTLTADGPVPRSGAARTLEDLYTTIAVTLEREDLARARPDERDDLLCRVLIQQRTLLILDNLETVDDERVLTFLYELPAPTKCIVTTRHRIDVAYPIRLSGMPEVDAQRLIAHEAEKRGVTLTPANVATLFKRTGGVPLALVWSVAQIGYGHSVLAVLRRLGDTQGPIAHYCFALAVRQIQSRPEYRLLLSLALFATDASREALGYVADLSELDRDEGLVELEKLSLANKVGERFSLLPLTKEYARNQLATAPALQQELEGRWMEYLRCLCGVARSEYYWRWQLFPLEEGPNLQAALAWAYQQGRADDVFVLTQGTCWYLDVIGQWTQEVEVALRAVQLARSVGDHCAAGRFLGQAGWIEQEWGEYAQAEARFAEALEHYRQAESREGECVAYQWLALARRKQHDFAAAEQFCTTAWNLTVALNSGDLQALVQSEWGKLARDQAAWSLAWERFSAVQDWCTARVETTPRDEILATGIWGQLALIAYHLGKYEEARIYCWRSLEALEQQGSRGYVATLYYRLALAEEGLGLQDAAYPHLQTALFWFERLNMQPDIAAAQQLSERLARIFNRAEEKPG